MQVLTERYSKNCLLSVMDQYSAVVRDMEQVVMFPSLLQDMQLSARAGAPSLYDYFTTLKAIRVDVGHGPLPQEEWQVKMAGGKSNVIENEAAETEEGKEVLGLWDLEAQFHLHYTSLHHILTHLTLKVKEVTRIYQKITGETV